MKPGKPTSNLKNKFEDDNAITKSRDGRKSAYLLVCKDNIRSHRQNLLIQLNNSL